MKLVPCTALIFAAAATVQAAALNPWTPNPFCKAVTKIVDALHADPKATKFCSSYLHISTSTVTKTTVLTPTPATTTAIVTSTATATETATISQYVTVSTVVQSTTTTTSTCTPYVAGERGPARRGAPALVVTTSKSTTTSAPSAVATPAVLAKSGGPLVSQICSCLSIPTPSTTTTKTSTLARATITTTTTTVVTQTATAYTTTTVTVVATSTELTTVTATAVSTFNGTNTTPEGSVYNEYSGNDLSGGDIGACDCNASNNDCYIFGYNLGTCNSFRTCQSVCDRYNLDVKPDSARKCIAVSYSTSGQQICYIKYDYTENGPCGEFYTDLYLDSAVLASAVR